MATEFISIKENMTVGSTLEYLQTCGREIGNIYELYVIDKLYKLKGSISLKELVTHKFETLISEILKLSVSPMIWTKKKLDIYLKSMGI